MRGLTKRYGDGAVAVDALRGIDLSFTDGEFVVLLGPSGSGKSTFLNIIGGLEPATAGTVHYRGTDLTRADEATLTRYRRECVGFVFQFYNLVPSLTARENVALVTERASDHLTADEALGMVGMGGRLDHFPSQLSGGEQQRVAIARAIARRPDLLLCDEPTGALDVTTGKLVLAALLDVNASVGATTIVITHNVAIAALAHRVIHFGDGRVVNVHTNTRRLDVAQLAW
ncbi:MAG: ABC transporter ATP-binding protein [Gemmatimonadaceae bacterium]|nr:ABC transporter ATP-binding protein [Gemmatimonadaceae bacterium]